MGAVEDIRVQRQVPQGVPQPADGRAGIGIAFAADEEGNFSIHSLHPQGTAYACGQLQPGDHLLMIDGHSVQGLDIPSVVSRIKGPIDTFVTLSIIKGDGQALYVDDAVPGVSSTNNNSTKKSSSKGEMKQLKREAEMAKAPVQPHSGSSWAPPAWKGPSKEEEAGGDGYGVWDYPDGKVYRGEMKGGKREGYGTITYTDGATYTGDWKADNRNGQGEYKYANGAWYRGGWIKGNRQGRGVCTFEDGNLYEGEWENNLPHGQGRCRFAEGSVYEGAFVGGKMHGWGALYTHEGTLWFEGEWKNGERITKGGAPGPAPPARDGPGPKVPPREEASWGDELNKIFITIQGGTRLPELEDGPPCPYVVTSLGPQTHITRTLGPCTEPNWDMEVAEFNLPPVASRGRTNLHVKLYHWVASHSRLLGEARVPINQLAAFTAKPQECSCSLLRPDGNPLRGKDLQKSEVHILVMLTKVNPMSGNAGGVPVAMYKGKEESRGMYSSVQQPMHFSMNQSIHSTMVRSMQEPVQGSLHRSIQEPMPNGSFSIGRDRSVAPPAEHLVDHVTCRLTLDDNYHRVAADGALMRYKGDVRSSIATALSVPVSRVAVTKLTAGSVIATVQFTGGDAGRSPHDLADELIQQASDPRSPLRQPSLLPKARGCKIVGDESAPPMSTSAYPQSTSAYPSAAPGYATVTPAEDDDLEWQRLQETSLARGHTPTPTLERGFISPRRHASSPFPQGSSVPPYGYGLQASPRGANHRGYSPVVPRTSPPRDYGIPKAQVLSYKTTYAPGPPAASHVAKLNPSDWVEMPHQMKQVSPQGDAKSAASGGMSSVVNLLGPGDMLGHVAKAFGVGRASSADAKALLQATESLRDRRESQPGGQHKAHRAPIQAQNLYDLQRDSRASQASSQEHAHASIKAQDLFELRTSATGINQPSREYESRRLSTVVTTESFDAPGQPISGGYGLRESHASDSTGYTSQGPRVVDTDLAHRASVDYSSNAPSAYPPVRQNQDHHVRAHSPAPMPPNVLGSSANPLGRQQVPSSGGAASDFDSRRFSHASSSAVWSGRCGVGLKLKDRDGRILVDKIQKDSAADMDARLVTGDVITAVDGEKISSLTRAKELVIGAEGTPVTIEVARGNLPFPLKVTLTRRSLHIERDQKSRKGESLDFSNFFR